MSDPKKIDRTDLVQALWPVDGPHSAESVAAAAAAIAELWRYLAHATRRTDAAALAAPADVCAAVSRLQDGARSAEQTLRQLRDWAASLESTDGLTRDDDRDNQERAALTAELASSWLGDARREMSLLVVSLGEAALPLGHLYVDQSLRERGDQR